MTVMLQMVIDHACSIKQYLMAIGIQREIFRSELLTAAKIGLGSEYAKRQLSSRTLLISITKTQTMGIT
jgi:hypothetical protein